MTKNKSFNELVIGHNNKLITNTHNLKFLGILTDNTLSWKGHTDKIVPRFSQACYVTTVAKPFLSQHTLKMIYYAYFRSVMTYGLFDIVLTVHHDKLYNKTNEMHFLEFYSDNILYMF